MGDSYLTKVVIPNGVTSIGSDAFSGCTGLTIYGYSGNYSETYANNNSIPFVELECDHSVLITKHYCPADSCTDGYTGDVYCQICGLLIETGRPIEKSGHIYESEVVGEATCISNGIIKHTCTICHDSYLEYTDTVGHDYTDTVVAPTCYSKGYTIHECSVCGYVCSDSYTNMIAHNYTESVVEPACDHAGYTEHVCSECGYTYTDNYTDALEHYYESTLISEASLTSVGIMHYQCKYCGDNYVETIPMLEPEIIYYLGDVDGDGEVTIIDATFIQRHLASLAIPFKMNEATADTDGDGEITIIDATFIQRYLASLAVPYDIGNPINK